jgi:hypothetical protein
VGTGCPFPGGKARPGCDADHSPPSSAEVKYEQELYLLSSHVPPWHVAGQLYFTYFMTTMIEEDDDPKINSEARSLLLFMKDYSFIFALIVWYDVLYQINITSKKLQSMETNMLELIDLMECCTKFCHQYRTDGFENVNKKL